MSRSFFLLDRNGDGGGVLTKSSTIVAVAIRIIWASILDVMIAILGRLLRG